MGRDRDRSRDTRAALQIVSLYAIFGALWIILSDKALEAILPTSEDWAQYAILKGWFYVAITSALLFFLIRKFFHEATQLTEQRLATLSLLEAIAEKSEDAIFAQDVEGHYILFNRAAVKLVGKAPDKVIGQNNSAIFPADLADSFTLQHKTLLATGKTFTSEETIQTALGEKILSTTKGPLVSADGEIFGTFGIVQDVTEWRRNAQELTRLNRALRLLGRTNLALIQTNSERDLLEEVCRLVMESGGYLMAWIGFPRDDETKSIDGLSFAGRAKEYLEEIELSWDEDKPAGKGPTGIAVRTRKTQTNQDVQSNPSMAPWRGAAAKFGYRSSISLPLTYEDALVGIFTIYAAEPNAFEKEEVEILEEMAANIAFGIQSIRERQGRREAEAASQAKSVFLANLSHEIRTPLNAISSMTNLLDRTRLSARQKELVNKINLAGGHLLNVISDILDLSKIEAAKISLDTAPIDLNAIINAAVSMLRDRLSGKDVKLDVSLAELPSSLVGDPLRLQQIILNFLSNAIKFTEEGSISVSTAIVEDLPEKTIVRIEVDDTGIGIAADAQPRLFEAFEQVDDSISRRYGGTGLGLAITRRLANLMGGTVGVSSVLGKGSLFWAEIPLAKSGAQPAPPSLAGDDPETELARQFSGRKILFVDDDEINRDAASMLLREFAGQDVTLAINGRQAVNFVTGQAFDIILMDVQMPGMDGLEATRRIRQLPNGKAVPVIALTGNAFPDDVQKCLAAGMNEVLAKPYPPEHLFGTVLKWLSHPR